MYKRGSHAFKFVVPKAKKDILKLSFFKRTINEWNSLPEYIVNTTSIDSLKSKLVKTDSAQRSGNKCKKYLLKNYS